MSTTSDDVCDSCGEYLENTSHYTCPNCKECCSSMGHFNSTTGGYSCSQSIDKLNKCSEQRCKNGWLYTGMDNMKWIPCPHCEEGKIIMNKNIRTSTVENIKNYISSPDSLLK